MPTTPVQSSTRSPDTTPAPDAAPAVGAEQPADPRRWRALPVLLLAAVMDLIDASIVILALPTIGHDLGAGNAALQLTVAAYGLAFAVLLITGGRLGDIYGRKRVFLAAWPASRSHRRCVAWPRLSRCSSPPAPPKGRWPA